MAGKSVTVRCACDKPLCQKAVRLEKIPGKGEVKLTILDAGNELVFLTVGPAQAWDLANYFLVFPERATAAVQCVLGRETAGIGG